MSSGATRSVGASLQPQAARSARCDGARGSVTVTVTVFPVVILLVLLVFQLALAYYAKLVVVAAAQDGLRAAQVQQGDVAAGEKVAREVVAESSGNLLSALSVRVTSGDPLTSRVTGDVAAIVPIPGLRLTVEGSAAGPVERFRPQGAP